MEDRVYEYLVKNHVGQKNMIKNQDLRNMFGIKSDKSMRKIIQNIRENKNYKRIIGSKSGKSGGFYICETPEEINETINNIKHRANQMLRMTHILNWKRGLSHD